MGEAGDKVRLFSKVELLDPERHRSLKWRCLKENCPHSCCLIPDRTFVVLEEVIPLSRHFPVVINVEIDENNREQRLLCAYFRLREDRKGCIYLSDKVGCLIEGEKPYTCRQYPFFINGVDLALDFTCPGFSEVEGNSIWDGEFVAPYFESNFYAYSLKLEESKQETQEFLNLLFDLNLVVGGKLSYESVEISFNMVDEENLFDLPMDLQKELQRKGYLRAIYAHINSLQNWERLIKRYISD